MELQNAINTSIERALRFLAKRQGSDGGFASFSSPSFNTMVGSVCYHTTFVPALILTALSDIDTPTSKTIRNKLAGFLAAQRNPNWSFNYWAKSAKQRASLPYPDDLDDTFCALIGLKLHDPSIIDEATLAKVTKLLLLTETEVGGPYRTWLVASDSEKVWLDIDIVVNSNIAYFLQLIDIDVPRLNHFIEKAIQSDDFASPYYPSTYPLMYYLTRSYSGPQMATLVTKLQQLYHTNHLTPLEVALLLSCYLQTGIPTHVTTLATRLLQAQKADGSWPFEAFCIDPAVHGITHYNGSPSLTTALAVEALSAYQKTLNTPPSKPTNTISRDNDVDLFQKEVLIITQRQCSKLLPDLRRQTINMLKRVAGSDSGGEIVTLPYYFQRGLKQLAPCETSLLLQLAAANLYGWVAYTIYDDFLDEEGNPGLLSVANVSMRYSLQAFHEALPSHDTFQQLVRQTFDVIDGANAWEIAHCRAGRKGNKLSVGTLPNYDDLEKLAERSLGHSLTPLAVLALQGVSFSSTSFMQLQSTLKHYLIVRQLNDDLHDWEDDLARGHITYVVGRLLQDSKVQTGQYALRTLLPTLRRQFWYHTLPAITHDMQQHIKLARQSLRQVTLLKQYNIINTLLNGVEALTKETRKTQHEAKSFLQYYRQA